MSQVGSRRHKSVEDDLRDIQSGERENPGCTSETWLLQVVIFLFTSEIFLIFSQFQLL